MTRGKCVKCGKRRLTMMDASCRQCLSEVLAGKVREANAPGASDQVKDACWAYMDRVYKAIGFQKLAYPLGDPELPPPQRGPDTGQTPITDQEHRFGPYPPI